jgi:hypothetical protein
MKGRIWSLYRRVWRWGFPVGLFLTVVAALLHGHVAVALSTALFWLGVLLILSGLPMGLRPLFPPYGKSEGNNAHRPFSMVSHGRPATMSALPRSALWGSITFAGLGLLLDLAGLTFLVSMPPMAILFFACGVLFVVVGIWMTVLAWNRMREVRIAQRFGFDNLFEYWKDREAKGWDEQRMANELRWSVKSVQRAKQRWTGINERLNNPWMRPLGR